MGTDQLVQIANSLTEQCGHKTFQISGFWADYGQPGSYAVVPVKSGDLNGSTQHSAQNPHSLKTKAESAG
jgi:hypothetical protein